MGKSNFLIKFKINITQKQKSNKEISEPKLSFFISIDRWANGNTVWKALTWKNWQKSLLKHRSSAKHKKCWNSQKIILRSRFPKTKYIFLQSNNGTTFHTNASDEQLCKLSLHIFFLSMMFFKCHFFSYFPMKYNGLAESLFFKKSCIK